MFAWTYALARMIGLATSGLSFSATELMGLPREESTISYRRLSVRPGGKRIL